MGRRADLSKLLRGLVRGSLDQTRLMMKRITNAFRVFGQECRDSLREGYEAGATHQSDTTDLQPISVAQNASSQNLDSFDPTTLSCEKYEVIVDATIDYSDKYGNDTRRQITTEEIYDYEDGVVVIRAFCHKRKDYRTFISSRIKYWVEDTSGKPIPVHDLAKYLVSLSQVDPANIAQDISSMADAEVAVFVYTAGRHTQNAHVSENGLTYYRISLPLANALVDYLLGFPQSRVLTESLNSAQIEDVMDILRSNLLAKKVGDTQVFCARRHLRNLEFTRRRSLVDFAERALAGTPAKNSVIGVLSDELLDPSFRIDKSNSLASPQVNQDQRTELDNYLLRLATEKKQIVADLRAESAAAEKELEEVAKTELHRSKNRVKQYLKSSECNVVRNLARQECHTQLLKNLQEGIMIFEREPFEQEIRRQVCALLTDEEMAKYGDMMLTYLGNGIRFGYLDTGLKKKNRGWYRNESGKVVIDLNNLERV